MFAFVLRALIFVVSAALGLIVADLILPGFRIDWSHWWGFVLAVVIFAVLQSVLTPWAAKVARRNAPALLGGIGIVSTFIALLIVVLIPGAGLGHRWDRPPRRSLLRGDAREVNALTLVDQLCEAGAVEALRRVGAAP